MVGVGSVIARRQLGRELRAFREATGRTREDVTNRHAGIASLAKLARIEQGLVSIRPGDVREMCLLYGVDPETTERLVEMARGTKHEEWWESQDAMAPRWFGMYLSLEDVADHIQAYEPTLVHGLFQTPRYSRQVELTTVPEPGPQVEAYVSTRMKRQQKIFGREKPLRIDLVLGEAALRVECEDPTVMPAQITHLRALAARPEIDVRIIPLRNGLHPGAYGKFTVMDFPERKDPAVVYVET